MNRTYISGPMTGLPGFNKPAFIAAEGELKIAGRNVVNPVNNGMPADADWHEHMRADIVMLMHCDSIFMLPGWSKSKGARLEWWIAKQLGFTIEGAPL